MSTYDLDASGLLCPMPVIKTQDFIRALKTGDTVSVHCTDPGAMNDIPAWCRINGHKILESKLEDGHVLIRIEVGNT